MTDPNNLPLTDEAIEAAVGGGGQWQQSSHGRWQWHSTEVAGTQTTSTISDVRRATVDGVSQFYRFNGTNEYEAKKLR